MLCFLHCSIMCRSATSPASQGLCLQTNTGLFYWILLGTSVSSDPIWRTHFPISWIRPCDNHCSGNAIASEWATDRCLPVLRRTVGDCKQKQLVLHSAHGAAHGAIIGAAGANQTLLQTRLVQFNTVEANCVVSHGGWWQKTDRASLSYFGVLYVLVFTLLLHRLRRRSTAQKDLWWNIEIFYILEPGTYKVRLDCSCHPWLFPTRFKLPVSN